MTEPDAEVAKRPGLDMAFKELPFHMDSTGQARGSMRICDGGPGANGGGLLLRQGWAGQGERRQAGAAASRLLI